VVARVLADRAEGHARARAHEEDPTR
jgi:hypothetical protein